MQKIKPKKQDEEKDKDSEKSKNLHKSKKQQWSNQDRILVLFVLLATVFAALFLAGYARNWKLPHLPRLALPQEAFEETFVIEKEEYPEKHNTIISEFEKSVRELSGVYGFRVVNLKTSERYGTDKREVFQAASLIKLPLMTMVYEMAEEEKLGLEDVHTLRTEDKIGGAGSLYYEDVGSVFTTRDLLQAMGKQSDNTAFNILRKIVGDEALQKYILQIGMKDTTLSDNTTTLADMSLFFEKLWNRRLVSVDSRDEILKFIQDTNYEKHLPAGIPPSTTVAHKYGRELHVVNDAGIVFAPESPFVIILLSKGVVESEADEIFPKLSRLIYEYEVNRLR